VFAEDLPEEEQATNLVNPFLLLIISEFGNMSYQLTNNYN
ncbi:unnamed protein product, partial [Brassica rapa subsp. trilocularis]